MTYSSMAVNAIFAVPSPSSTARFAFTSKVPMSSLLDIPINKSLYGPVTRYVKCSFSFGIVLA